MRLAFQSARGAPGTTALALATALELNSRGCEVLLVEADPAGGVLAADLGLPCGGRTERSRVQHGPTDARCRPLRRRGLSHAGRLAANADGAVLGPQSLAAWTEGAPRFVDLAASLPAHVVIDLGRLGRAARAGPVRSTQAGPGRGIQLFSFSRETCHFLTFSYQHVILRPTLEPHGGTRECQSADAFTASPPPGSDSPSCTKCRRTGL